MLLPSHVKKKKKKKKSEFLKAKIIFLGYTVDGNVIHTMDDKISAIKKFREHELSKMSALSLGYVAIIDLSLMGLPKWHLL